MTDCSPTLTRRAICAAPLLGAGLAAAGMARAGGHGFETVFHFPRGESPTTRPLATPDAQGRRRLLNIVTARLAWRIPLNGQADADDAFAVYHHAFSSFTLASDGLAYGTRTRPGAGAVCRWDVPKGQSIENVARLRNDRSEGTPPGGLIEGFDGALYGTAFGGGSHEVGTIFRTTTTGDLAVLHTFDFLPGEGHSPVGSLTRGDDGNYYGVTAQGGEFDPGTLYRMTPDGAVAFLYSFGQGGANDGGLPADGMTLAPDGLFYGMTPARGKHSSGTIYSLSHDGAYRSLHDFQAEEGRLPQATLFAMPDGRLYGTCGRGGAFDLGTVFRFRPERPGRIEVLHSFSGKDCDGALPMAGLELADDGNLYSTTREGGLFGGGILFRVRP